MGRTSKKEGELRRRRIRRAAALAFLGNRCVRCGFSDVRALQIDHVNGNGYAERNGSGGAMAIYKRVLAGSQNYQLLCANCNWIKRVEQGELAKSPGGYKR